MRFVPAVPSLALGFTALLGVFALPGCGGGGGGAPSAGRPGAAFLEPTAAVSLPPGANLAVRVTGLPPGEPVLVTLDADGNPATTADAHVLGALAPSAAGEVEATLPTEGVPEGDYRLLAVSAGGAGARAVAEGGVSVASGAWFAVLGGPAVERPTFVAPLADGRVAIAGTVVGTATYETASGPVSVATGSYSDAFVAVFDGPGAAAMRTIVGERAEFLLDLAAGPAGGFSVVGGAVTIPTLGGPTESPPEAFAAGGRWLGLVGAYDRDADLEHALLAWGFASEGATARSAQIAAVAYGPDGGRWIGLVAQDHVRVGGTALTVPFGLALVRLDASGHADDTPLAVVRGDVEVGGLVVDATGHLYVGGSGYGTLVFDPETSVDAAEGRGFVARYAPTGALLGVWCATGNADSFIYDLAVSPGGFVYAVGQAYAGSTAFGGLALDPVGLGSDGFVLALASDLTPLWARSWTATPGGEFVGCSGVAATLGGGCVVTGITRGSARVGNGGGAIVGDRSFGAVGAEDFASAVARYRPDGSLEWLVGFEGPGDQRVFQVAVDAQGCVLVPGASNGPVTLRDRDGTTVRGTLHAATLDGFLLRLDPDGRVR